MIILEPDPTIPVDRYCGHETRAEMETIVRFSEDPCEPMTIYTFRKSLADKLLKAGGQLKRQGVRDGKVKNWTVLVPREWFRAPRPKSESRAAAAKAAMAARQKPD